MQRKEDYCEKEQAKYVPEDIGSVGMDLNEANVIRVGIPFLDLLHGVVIVHSQLHVIRAGDDPVLAHDEASAAHRVGAHLERLDQGLLERVSKFEVANEFR